MLQAILRRAVAALQKVKNFYTVVEVKSMDEFLKFVRNEKSPNVYIFLSWSNYIKPDSGRRPCCIRFTSFLWDGRVVVTRIQEEIKLVGLPAKDQVRGKQYVNEHLLMRQVKESVRLILSLNKNTKIQVRDLYGNLVSPDEFKPELF